MGTLRIWTSAILALAFAACGGTALGSDPSASTADVRQSRGDTWRTRASMSEARTAMGIAPLGSGFAVFGGCFVAPGSSAESALASAERYDPAANEWSALPSLQQARCRPAGVSIAGALYAFGGATAVPLGTTLASVEVLDPGATAWRFATSAPAPLTNPRAVVLGREVLVVTQDAAWTYDPAADTWTEAEASLTARSLPGAAVAGGLAYLIGGVTPAAQVLSSAESFSPRTGTWSAASAMPTARYALAAAEAGGGIFALGGLDAAFTRLATNEELNPVAGFWCTRASMPTGRAYLGAVSVGGLLYAAGGLVPFSVQTGVTTAALEEYTPPKGAPCGRGPAAQ